MRWRAILRLIGINLLVLIGGIGLIEAFFGNWTGKDPMTLLNIPRNGTWQYEVTYPGVPDAERQIFYTRDRYGLRGTHGDVSNVRLLTLGGSTTDQLLVAEDHTWQAVIQRKFYEAGIDFGIANAGLSGRTTVGHIRDLQDWIPLIPDFAPDFIMFYIGINDMFKDAGSEDKDHLVNTFQSLKEVIKTRSALYYVYRTSVGVYRAREYHMDWSYIDYENAKWTDTPYRDDYQVLLGPRLDKYRERLYVLNREARGLGAVPVFVTQRRGDYRNENGKVYGLASTNASVSREGWDSRLGRLDYKSANGVDYYLILQLFNDVLMEVCREVEAVCIDLARDIQFEIGDFYDHLHTTRSGSTKVGEFLYPHLSREVERLQ